jgi:hypothetical protein
MMRTNLNSTSQYQHDFNRSFSDFYCITNPESLVFYGDYNGEVSAGLAINFDECDSEASCLNKKQKTEYFT